MPQPPEPPPNLEDLQRWIDEATQAIEGSLDFAGRRIQLCIKIGQALTVWKKAQGHGNWMTWLGNHMPRISVETARKWMRLGEDARSNRLDLSNVKSIRAAYIYAGIMPETPGGASMHGDKPVSYLVHADRLQAVLKEMNIGELSGIELAQLRERLLPIATFYHALPDVTRS